MTGLIRIVGVRFKRAGKVYYFNPGELSLCHGDQVVVETATGLAFGDVVVEPKEVPEDDVIQPIRSVVRKVGQDDRQRLVANRDDERKAYDIALQRIEAHGLPMRLVNAEYTFDRNRLTFFFTADNRVDFRALVHDLARQFGVRIELRQIGVRDEAKEVGGIGVCGRELCCTSWMGEFAPVSIRMAKQQSLSLNPNKLTGQCGRLKCCLKFENDTYREVRALLPEPGDAVAVALPPSAVGLEEGVAVGAGQGLRAVSGGGFHPGARNGSRNGTVSVGVVQPDSPAVAAIRKAEEGHVVVQGRVREVLVTWESVDMDIGEGRRVRVSLKQLEAGEAVVLTGKRADKSLENAVLAAEAEAKAEAEQAGETVDPRRGQKRDDKGRRTDGRSRDVVEGTSAPEGGEQRQAGDKGQAKGNRPPRRRRRPARRRSRRRPEEAS